MKIQYELDKEQVRKLNEWYNEIIKEIPKDVTGQVYYGAIGGGLTYSITYTSLGAILKVKEAITGKEIDLTDYDAW